MGHVGQCPVQEYGLEQAEAGEVRGQCQNCSALVGNCDGWCETHSDQVSGAEEPVDLGRLCK